MARSSLGLIETVGLAAGIEAADVMLKAANVKLIGYELSKGGGLVTVKITGEVGAVKAAIEAAKASAGKVQSVYSSTIIPRPSADLDLFNTTEPLKNKQFEQESKQETKAVEQSQTNKTRTEKAQPKKPAQATKATSTNRKTTKRKPATKPSTQAKTKVPETKPTPSETVEIKPVQTKMAPKKQTETTEKTKPSTNTEITTQKAPDKSASSETAKPPAKGAETDKKA